MSSTDRVPKRPAPAVRQWETYVRARLGMKHLTNVHDDNVTRIAALLTLMGPPRSARGDLAFRAFSDLLFATRGSSAQYGQVPGLRDALDALPPDPESLIRVVVAVVTFQQIHGSLSDPKRSRFNTRRVIEVMLQLPDPKTYVENLAERGFDHPGAVFHENTLKRARTTMRGVFGRFEGEEDYWSSIETKINLIE